MAGLNNSGSESDFVIGACVYSDCNCCPSNKNFDCPDINIGGGTKPNRIYEVNSALGEEIKRNLTRDNGDTL